MDLAALDPDSAVANLISLWQNRHAQGDTVTAAELCRDRPELLPALERQIAALQKLDALAKDMHEMPTLPPQSDQANGVHKSTTIDPYATLPPSSQDPQAPPSLQALTGAPAIPGYEILSELGRGGMGVVYQARHTKLRRIVALKMILSGAHAGEAALARFRTEAEAIARLQHPNIVQIHEIGEHGGLPFFSLEFCAGGALEKKLGGTPLPPMEAAALVEVLARAMATAHAKGVIHRDLKPANVLLAEDGKPKITDFGLARKLDEVGQTATGAVMGTPSYMAPEQAGGKSVGPLCEVYSLGAILYECLTGRPPFRGPTTMDTVMQVVSDDPVPPRQLQPRTPKDLETICLKCLQKDSTRRYPSASALAEDLRRFQAGEPIHARPVGRMERTVRWCRRYPTVTALLVLLALFGGVMFYLFGQANALRQNEAEARQAAVTALEEESRAKQATDQALADLKDEKRQTTDLLYATRINLVHREWQASIVHRARQLLSDCQLDQRGWEWDYLKGLFDARSVVLSGMGFVVGVALTPDSRRAVTFGKDGMVRVWDARSGAGLKQLALDAHRLAISPNGARAAVAVEKSIKVFELETGRIMYTTDLGAVPCGLEFVRDGADLAVVLLSGDVRYLDPATGKERSRLGRKLDLLPATEALLRSGQGIAISRDGRWLAQGGTEGKLCVWDGATGKRVLYETAHLHLVRQVAFSPDGRRLASPGMDGDIRVWDMTSRQPIRRLTGHRNMVHCVVFSPDGQRLVSGSQDTTARVWDVETGENILTFAGHGSEVFGVAFGDGRVASASPDATARIWNVDERVVHGKLVQNFLRSEKLPDPARRGSHEALTFFAYLGGVQHLAFSPDGRTLAAVGRLTPSAHANPTTAPEVTLWDLNGRRLVRELSVPQERPHRLAFSPDGRHLAVGTGGGGKKPAELNVFDSARGKRVWHWEGPPGEEVQPSFAPGGARLAATLNAASGENFLLTWEAASGKELFRQPLAGRHTEANYSSDGKTLVAGGADNGGIVVEKFDAETGKRQGSWPAGALGLSAVVCGAEGLVAAATMGDRPAIKLFRLEDGREVGSLEGHVGGVKSLAFSPDGRRLLSCGTDFAVRLWHTGSGRELLTFREHTDIPTAVAWSPDGRRIGSAGQDNMIKVWEATADPVPRTDDWPLLFHDSFTADGDLGRWKPSQKSPWEVRGGTLHGRQINWKVNDQFSFAFAGVDRTDAKLPRTAEVRFAYRAERPLVMGVGLADGQRSYTVLLCGGAIPFGRPCAKLQRIAEGGRISYVGLERTFTMQLGHWHHVRILRQPQRIRAFVDGLETLSEPIPNGELPSLSLFGMWGAVGDEIEFKDVEVRTPAAARR